MAVVYTNKGKEHVVDRIDDTESGAGTDHITAGTGAGSFTGASNALFTEVAEARVAVTKSQSAVDTNQWQATQTYSSGVPKTITNAGVLTASSSGDLLIGADGLSILVNSGDSIQFTFRLQQT
jgi:hypothetical protein